MRTSAFAALLLCPALTLAKSPAGDAAHGKEVFTQCAGCHSPDSTAKKVGPGLKGLYRRKMQNGQRSNDRTVLAVINKGATGMPPYEHSLSESDKADLLAYLKKL